MASLSAPLVDRRSIATTICARCQGAFDLDLTFYALIQEAPPIMCRLCRLLNRYRPLPLTVPQVPAPSLTPWTRHPGGPWTAAAVHTAFHAWLTAHPGEIAMKQELLADATLPSYSVVHAFCGNLKNVYRWLDTYTLPGVFACYEARLQQVRAAAGRQGGKVVKLCRAKGAQVNRATSRPAEGG